MQDKKPHRINEDALREKFTSYRVSFNPSCLEILENEVAHVKTHASLELPDTKKLVRFGGIFLILIAIGCAAFFTYDYVKNMPASAPEKDTVAAEKPIVQPTPEPQPKQEAAPAVVKADTIKAEVPKHDTVMPVVTQKTKTALKTYPPQVKNAAPKKDTSSVTAINPAQVDSVKKKAKADTASANKNQQVKKKKKKRKNSLDATEDIRQSEPNSSDDDVVIPNN